MPPAAPLAHPSIFEDMSSSSSAVTSETHSCPYKDCHKSFSKKYNLKAHLRLHTGEEPFECDRPDCRKKFKWRSSLSSHSVWHTRQDNAASSPTTKPSTASSKSASPRKSNPSRPVRVAPHPSKKRPRSESSRSSLDSLHSINIHQKDTSRNATATASAAKKRRTKPGVSDKPIEQVKEEVVHTIACFTCSVDEEAMTMAPGSPVTSDGSNSEQALDLDEFSRDILQPLLARDDTLHLEHDADMDAVIGAVDGHLFGYDETPSCGPLSGFDSRFEQFDVDNFANFYLNKMEGL